MYSGGGDQTTPRGEMVVLEATVQGWHAEDFNLEQ